ncbi:MAG: hypothetical protein Q4E21_07010 [Clostridia bacterium]|nr:hypothetical protein [Clostridia bacterium]
MIGADTPLPVNGGNRCDLLHVQPHRSKVKLRRKTVLPALTAYGAWLS